MSKMIALVSGASRGIGAAIADRFAADGYYVIGTATSDESASKISERLADSGTGKRLDVADSDSVDQLFSGLKDAKQQPQIVVNNAGITRDQILLRMTEEDWDTLMNTNLKSVYRMSKACLRPMMKARYGRIINITSVIGVLGNAGQSNYAAAKAGVIAFSKSLAQEIGSRGITVNVVAPGFIDTDMTRNLPEAQKTALLDKIPLKSLGQRDDIAHAVGFLASKQAGYITGETLHVNGGMYMS